jgi:hypothetical protein
VKFQFPSKNLLENWRKDKIFDIKLTGFTNNNKGKG